MNPVAPIVKPPPCLTVNEAARRLRATPEHIADLIEEGQLQAIDISGKGARRKCWRIPVESIDAFKKSRSNLAEPAPRR